MGFRYAIVAGSVGSLSLVAGTPYAAHAAPYSHHSDDWPTQNFGNGAHNRNSFLIESPVSSRDFQHLRNANQGGINISSIASCRKYQRRCRIIQRNVVAYP